MRRVTIFGGGRAANAIFSLLAGEQVFVMLLCGESSDMAHVRFILMGEAGTDVRLY